MEILEKLTKWAEKKELTAKDKEQIAKLAAEHGIEINPLCPDCYRDAVIQLHKLYKEQAEPKDAGGYQLKPGVDVTLCARNGNEYRVCEATLTAGNARKWLANGLPTTFFAAMPNESNEQD